MFIFCFTEQIIYFGKDFLSVVCIYNKQRYEKKKMGQKLSLQAEAKQSPGQIAKKPDCSVALLTSDINSYRRLKWRHLILMDN